MGFGPREMELEKPLTGRLVVLTIVSNELEAQLLVNLLKANGIQAFAAGGFTSAFRAEAPGDVRVQVMQEKLEQAQSILERCNQERAARKQTAAVAGENPTYESRLTRFSIRSLLVLQIVGVVGSLASWGLGVDAAPVFAINFAVSMAFIFLILKRLRSSSN